eukprot:SAG31_NODE_2898_length_4934_cov_2.220430_1_plen_248_part_00
MVYDLCLQWQMVFDRARLAGPRALAIFAEAFEAALSRSLGVRLECLLLHGNHLFGARLLASGKVESGSAGDDSTAYLINTIDADQSGWEALLKILKRSAQLRSLNINDVGMGPRGSVAFAENALNQSDLQHALLELSCERNPIVGEVKYKGKSVNADCHLTDFGILVRAISKCSRLKILNINKVGMGPRGADVLESHLFGQNATLVKTLRELWVTDQRDLEPPHKRKLESSLKKENKNLMVYGDTRN